MLGSVLYNTMAVALTSDEKIRPCSLIGGSMGILPYPPACSQFAVASAACFWLRSRHHSSKFVALRNDQPAKPMCANEQSTHLYITSQCLGGKQQTHMWPLGLSVSLGVTHDPRALDSRHVAQEIAVVATLHSICGVIRIAAHTCCTCGCQNQKEQAGIYPCYYVYISVSS